VAIAAFVVRTALPTFRRARDADIPGSSREPLSGPGNLSITELVGSADERLRGEIIDGRMAS
jgi:hypothetical protein